MKKILFFLVALTIVSGVLFTSCSSTPDLNKEREVQGTVVAVGQPFTFNGIETVILVWQKELSSGDTLEAVASNDQWLCYPAEMVGSSLEGKTIKIGYKIMAGYVHLGDDKFNGKPLIQILSIEEIAPE
jgi:hypothetical protein